MPALKEPRSGSYMPKITWLLYAENPVAPICRKLTGDACAARGRLEDRTIGIGQRKLAAARRPPEGEDVGVVLALLPCCAFRILSAFRGSGIEIVSAAFARAAGTISSFRRTSTDSPRRLGQRVRSDEQKPTALEVSGLPERGVARGPELGKE